MENQFAKLFNYPTGQLLLTIEEDEFSIDKFVLVSRTDAGGISAITKATHDKEEQAVAALAAIDDQAAEKMFNSCQALLTRKGHDMTLTWNQTTADTLKASAAFGKEGKS